MKAEKNTILGAEALKKVKEIVRRIETEKEEIRKELATTEAELNARQSGTTKASGFNVKEILENDNDETIEKLRNKKTKLKNALAKPYYADAEFREYSLIYLMGYLEEHNEERERLNKEHAKMEYEHYILPRKMREVEAKQRANIDEFARKMVDIGLAGETEGMGLYGVNYIIDRYKKKCDEYETN